MGKSTKNINIDIDHDVVARVAKATALAKQLGPKGFKMISPPTQLRDKAKPILRPKFHPIEAAETQLKTVSSGFRFWLKEDRDKLLAASKAYNKSPHDSETFNELSKCIHTIKGNAPILGCDAAGMIASPLSDLIEECSAHKKAPPILALAVHAISQAIDLKTPMDDKELLTTITMLNQLNSNCIGGKNVT